MRDWREYTDLSNTVMVLDGRLLTEGTQTMKEELALKLYYEPGIDSHHDYLLNSSEPRTEIV